MKIKFIEERVCRWTTIMELESEYVPRIGETVVLYMGENSGKVTFRVINVVTELNYERKAKTTTKVILEQK